MPITMDPGSLLRIARAAVLAGAVVLGAHAPTAALPQEPCSFGLVRDPAPGPFVQLTSTVVSARFGVDVAMDGERLAIGKWLYQHPATLFVYERDGSNWFVKQQLANPATGNGYGYGAVIDLSGPLLVTSDTWEPSPSVGRVYVYEDRGGTWTLVATLAASDEKQGIAFGASLATDGNRIVVGATGQDNAIGVGTGAIYVFEDQGSGWSEVQKIAPSLRQNGMQFGSQVALIGDWLFVSAPRRLQGVIYVYRHGPGGYTFVQVLQGTPGSTYRRLGTGLAVDGSTLLASENPFGGGSVRAFELVSGAWTQVDLLQGSDGSIGPVVAAGGGWAAASNTLREGGVGAIYLFRKDPTGWNEVAILEPTHRDVTGGFGAAVAVAPPFVVGTAPADRNAGSVEAFTVDGSACRSLDAFPRTMSVARRGLNAVTLDAGAELAGAAYVVLSTLHGTSPGIALDGFRLPLNPGAWFSLTSTSFPFWSGEVGVLDERGRAVAWLDVPALRDPGMVGLEMNHAVVVFSEGRAVHVSNTSALRFVP